MRGSSPRMTECGANAAISQGRRSRDDETRHPVPEALALLHLHQMGRYRGRDHSCPETDVGRLCVMAQSLPKAALRPFLPADVPILAAIFVAAIEELTGDD